MTPAELEAIRQADAEDDPRGGLQARIDRRVLLAYVDELMKDRRRTQAMAYRDNLRRLHRNAMHLLAHQQALVARLRRMYREAAARYANLRAENERKDAEIERLKALSKALAEDLGGIVHNHDEHGHVDGSWFDSARAQLAALGEEVRDDS